jgi:hypothetical protein
MRQYSTIEDLFQDEPGEWGLRGDPYLWGEMQKYFSGVPIPGDEGHLKSCISKFFKSLTGKALSTRKNFYVDGFANGGMSSGYIDPTFWRKKAIPLLIQRFRTNSDFDL